MANCANVCIFKLIGATMNRIIEGSTWAGFAAIFQALAFVFPAHSLALNAATAAAGAVAVMLKDKGAPDATNTN